MANIKLMKWNSLEHLKSNKGMIAFLCAELGISVEPRKDHASYLQSWLKALKNDKRFIFSAAAQASQAVAYLKELVGQVNQKQEVAEQEKPILLASNPSFC